MFVQAYSMFALGYLWYRYGLLFYNDSGELSYTGKLDSFSVIVPCFNEEPRLIDKCLNSLLESDGDKEVIVVDDASTNKDTLKCLKKWSLKVKVVFLEENVGKREAQVAGLFYASKDFIVTIDSDTVVGKDSILKLIQPLQDESVGAVTGQALVLNKNHNLLTKMINSRYWGAFNIDRKSLSRSGVVTCCTGVISAYKKSFLLEHMEEYLGQTFLGNKCTYGDDRHLTNIVLKNNLKVVYVEEALAYTEAPTNFKKFIKQQLRWKKSFLRESWISLGFAWNRSKIFFVEVLFNLLLPFLSLFIRLSAILLCFINPLFIIPLVLGIVVMSVIRNLPMFFKDKNLLFYMIPYAFVHELVLYWLYFVALFSLKNNGWGTR